MNRSKRQEYINLLQERKYLVPEAIEFLQSAPKVKFNESTKSFYRTYKIKKANRFYAVILALRMGSNNRI